MWPMRTRARAQAHLLTHVEDIPPAQPVGGMRERLLTDPGTRDRYLSGFVSVDLMLLRTFRILTLLLRSRNPKLLFQELDSLLRNRTVFAFFGAGSSSPRSRRVNEARPSTFTTPGCTYARSAPVFARAKP